MRVFLIFIFLGFTMEPMFASPAKDLSLFCVNKVPEFSQSVNARFADPQFHKAQNKQYDYWRLQKSSDGEDKAKAIKSELTRAMESLNGTQIDREKWVLLAESFEGEENPSWRYRQESLLGNAFLNSSYVVDVGGLHFVVKFSEYAHVESGMSDVADMLGIHAPLTRQVTIDNKMASVQVFLPQAFVLQDFVSDDVLDDDMSAYLPLSVNIYRQLIQTMDDTFLNYMVSSVDLKKSYYMPIDTESAGNSSFMLNVASIDNPEIVNMTQPRIAALPFWLETVTTNRRQTFMYKDDDQVKTTMQKLAELNPKLHQTLTDPDKSEAVEQILHSTITNQDHKEWVTYYLNKYTEYANQFDL